MAKRIIKGRQAHSPQSHEQTAGAQTPAPTSEVIPADEPVGDAESEAAFAVADAQAPDAPISHLQTANAAADAPPDETLHDEAAPPADGGAAPPQVSTRAPSPRATTLDEVSALNGAVLSYLRGERGAALAHWRAISLARSPAEVIRLQIAEMQRAADASLTCLSAIATRSGRVAAAFKAA